MSELTRVLSALSEGNSQAAERLLPLLYDELRQLAAQRLAQEKPGQTLDATALVHEAYLRLVAGPLQELGKEQIWKNRAHFFAAAAEAMRRILVENARRKRTLKRGGNRTRGKLYDVAAPAPSEDVLALDTALNQLAEKDPVKAELVKLRYFTGLTIAQAAEILGISTTTADRYWAYSRAWLHQQIVHSAP